MPGKSKKGGGLESSPVYKKQAYGTAKSPFMMKGSPLKQAIGGGPGEAVKHWLKYKAKKKATTGLIPGIGAAVLAGEILKPGVERVIEGIKTGKPKTKLKGDWKRVPKKKYI